jgi:hypothetical protein
MRELSAFPQWQHITPFGQRISSKYERALRSSIKMEPERFKRIVNPEVYACTDRTEG